MREEVLSVREAGEETFVDLASKVINHRDDSFRTTHLRDPLVKAVVSFAHAEIVPAGLVVADVADQALRPATLTAH